MLSGDTSADEAAQDRVLRQLGLQAVRDPKTAAHLWAEHWPAARLFDATLTQWTVAPSGRRIGLRYEAVTSTMDLIEETAGMPADERRAVFADLQLMEVIALEHWRAVQPDPPA